MSTDWMRPRPRPLQYRALPSPLHRLASGPKLVAAMAIGGCALAADRPQTLIGLILLICGGYALAQLSIVDWWRDVRWLLLQGAIIIALTIALRGPGSFPAAMHTALQLVLVFLPVALVLRTTANTALLTSLRAWLPARIGFAFTTTFRLGPVFARELGDLVEMQRARGARLAPEDLWRPIAWRDWLACIAVPMTVRAIEVSEEAAEAAEMRGISSRDPRADSAPNEEKR